MGLRGENPVPSQRMRITHLLVRCDVPSDVFYADGVLDRQSMALALYSCLVDDDPAVCCQTCIPPRPARQNNDSNSTSAPVRGEKEGRDGRYEGGGRDVPAKARQTWSSIMATLRTVLGSWSCKAVFFSTPRTTHEDDLTPTAAVPFATASKA